MPQRTGFVLLYYTTSHNQGFSACYSIHSKPLSAHTLVHRQMHPMRNERLDQGHLDVGVKTGIKPSHDWVTSSEHQSFWKEENRGHREDVAWCSAVLLCNQSIMCTICCAQPVHLSAGNNHRPSTFAWTVDELIQCCVVHEWSFKKEGSCINSTLYSSGFLRLSAGPWNIYAL